MKNALLFLLLLAVSVCTAQKPYWQQQADVTIQVQLNDSAHAIDGFEKISYTNHSPDTLYYIWFHLWPNAYKNDGTAFSDQWLQLGRTDFYFSTKEQRGYINHLDFKVDGVPAKTEVDSVHIDIIKVLLAAPLPPSGNVTVTTPFHVKLPFLFSRSGYKRGAFQLTQWYPKPAVYDAQGWHPMPYLEQGEFYSEFGDYDITISLPQDYVVAATGVLQNETETASQPLKEIKIKTQKKEAVTYNGHLKKRPATLKNKRADPNFFTPPYQLKTLQYKQAGVHDFAWVANKNFRVDTDTCRLESGKVITVFIYYLERLVTPWHKGLQFAKQALRFYSTEIGDYPYATIRIAASEGAAGGMEYPMLSIIGPTTSEKELDLLIAHEIGHNWFQSALATNERDAPWLDEGINTFYEKKYRMQKGDAGDALENLLFQTLAKQKRDQPISTPAPLFSELNYNLVAYDKAAQWFSLIEQQAGSAAFRQAMQHYFAQWRFKHPHENDLKNALAAVLPDTAVFQLLHTKGVLPNQQLASFKIISPLLPFTVKAYLQHPSKNRLFFSPVLGYNQYDKAMPGVFFTNYGLPPSRFQFLALPVFGIASKKWNGIGSIKYTQYSDTWFRAVEASLSGMGFSKSYLLDSNGRGHYERFYKITPALRLTFNAPLQSAKEKYIEARSFFITEKNFSKFVTKAVDGFTYVDSLATENRYLNQLTWNISDYRALYPYSYKLQVQQARAFYRVNATANYFFNYTNGGGASVRLFFAKFGYLINNPTLRIAAARFQPKLLGTTGEEDYTYSTYFLGRTASYANNTSVVKNSGLAAQQILLRDGGFKLRLDPFEFLQGRSENWIASLNLNTTLPRQLLPAAIPLKLFLDLGTYAEAKKQQSGSRILYVGGLQLTLLHQTINIYAPLLYSAVFRDNLKSLPEQNTFVKRVTFSIDVGQLSVRRLTRNKLSL